MVRAKSDVSSPWISFLAFDGIATSTAYPILAVLFMEMYYVIPVWAKPKLTDFLRFTVSVACVAEIGKRYDGSAFDIKIDILFPAGRPLCTAKPAP